MIVGGSVPARTKPLLLLPLERTLAMSREADLLPGPPATGAGHCEGDTLINALPSPGLEYKQRR